ncbi:MAG: glycosyltransferase family 4 protein, partial [Ilumatobacteraceae bacterium]
MQSRSHGDRGIARFCIDLALAIERRDPHHIDFYLVNPDLPIPSLLEPLIRAGKVRRSDDLGGSPLRLLHVGSPVELDVSLDRMLVGTPELLVANLYDLIPLVFPDRYLRDRSGRRRYETRLGMYVAADVLLADSQSAADDAVRLLGVDPARCRVIGGGASDSFRPASDGDDPIAAAEAGVVGLRPGFILVPTGIDWRKNLDGVIDAYSQLDRQTRSAHQLVLVCKASERERAHFTARARKAGCADSFLMTGFVSDELLVSLYRAAHLVVVPSRYEGFGLPVLEARQCGALVVCGDNSSLRELVPDPSARFDADDADDMARVMAAGVLDDEFRRQLRAMPMPPFTWDNAAAITIDAHRELLRRPSPRLMLADGRTRIAYVTPLPPVESGIAHYSYELVAALARVADVQVFSDQPMANVAVPPGVKVSPLSDLPSEAAVGEFDHVVYALGNNMFHHGALSMLRRVSGHVHLHDVRLVNCYADEPWPEIVAWQYPGRYSDEDLRALTAPWSPLVTTRSVFLLADVGRHAAGVMVHSHHAASLVSLDLGVPVHHVGPLACRPRPGVREPDPRLVVSLGIVAETKQSWKVADAATLL